MMPAEQLQSPQPMPSVPSEEVPAGQPELADPIMREITPLSDPNRAGPVSNRPEGPSLNAPRRAEAQGVPAYNWGSLGLFPGVDASPESNQLRQVQFESSP